MVTVGMSKMGWMQGSQTLYAYAAVLAGMQAGKATACLVPQLEGQCTLSIPIFSAEPGSKISSTTWISA